MLCVAMGASLSAHRRDELLHAARIGIEPDRVRVEISLTPGIEVADAFLREIDDDGDLRLSAAERRAYAARVIGQVALRVDDSAALRLWLVGARFPGAVDLRSGEAAITLEMEAALPSLSSGAHRLFFHNDSAATGGVFMANALVPESDRVGVTGQERDFLQRQLTVAFELRESQPSGFRWAWLGFICVVPAGLARALRPRRTWRPFCHPDKRTDASTVNAADTTNGSKRATLDESAATR